MDVKRVRAGDPLSQPAVTIREVAEMAGVSVTTVSHSLNGRGRIAPSTRERVIRAASELGYKANVHAQRLVTRRSHSLAIQISHLAEPSKQTSLVPHSEYFLELLDGASATAAELGYALILTPPTADAGQLGGLAIDGAIIVDPCGDEPLFRALIESGQPLVTTGRAAQAGYHPPSVDNDHRAAAIEALDHLEASGFRRPALLITDTSRSYIADILDGYRQWTAQHGLAGQVIELQEPQAQTATALRSMLTCADPPDAVYTGHEDLALSLLNEAKRLGMSVPEDLGIASSVDSNVLLYTSPQITGVFLHPRQIGSEAILMLIDLIERIDPEPQNASVPTVLRRRGSTSKELARSE